MSTTPTTRDTTALRPVPRIAAAAAGAALLLMLVGTYVDTPFKTSGTGRWALVSEGQGIGELLLIVAFAAVGAAVVFGVVVARGLRRAPQGAARAALVVAVVGLLSLAVFWTGLPAIVAAGAAVLALDARNRLGRAPAPVGVALILAGLTVVGAAWLALTG